MLKYPCLVLDHDDTVVQTEKSIGYPYFREYLKKIRPGVYLSFPEYVRLCNNMVFADMCKAQWQFTDQELHNEYTLWKEYSRNNIPPLCPGIDRIINRHKQEGGILCVSSLSSREIIERDYISHFGFLPDKIYDYDMASQHRKPSTYALEDILSQYDVQPDQILVIDDRMLGQQMAKAAGVKTAFAGWSKVEFPELTEQMRTACEYCFDSTEELEKFLFG